MTIKSSYEACGIVEGFAGENYGYKTILKAWAYLIKTGLCWQLQGWYGRNARDLIESGTISRTGRVNWKGISENEIN